MLIKIIEHFENIKFNVVSNLEAFTGLKLKNLKLYKGSFGSKDLRDSQLRDLYQNARIVILPLKILINHQAKASRFKPCLVKGQYYFQN